VPPLLHTSVGSDSTNPDCEAEAPRRFRVGRCLRGKRAEETTRVMPSSLRAFLLAAGDTGPR